MDTLGSGESRQQYDPSAHARSDKDLRALGQRVENRNRILRPAADRSQSDIAARRTMSEVVETHESVAAAPAIFLKERGFGSGHVRAETGAKQNTRGTTGEPPVGDCCTIVTW
jgi:hypothetical protein